jgi:hypothetical protein
MTAVRIREEMAHARPISVIRNGEKKVEDPYPGAHFVRAALEWVLEDIYTPPHLNRF